MLWNKEHRERSEESEHQVASRNQCSGPGILHHGKSNGLCSDSHDPKGDEKELTCQRSAKRGKRVTQGKSGNRQDRDLSFEIGKLKIFIRKTS